MVYLRLAGRIGNQLFMYAFARTIQKRAGDSELIIDDSRNIDLKYENSLVFYNLPDCRFTSIDNELHTNSKWSIPYFWFRVWKKLTLRCSYRQRYNLEKALQPLLNKFGFISMENGYIHTAKRLPKDILMDGYFQSEKFFKENEDEIRRLFSQKKELEAAGYPGLEAIRARNTVCISIKVQHNVGNPMYDVCNNGYWQSAIDYITHRVEQPLFFICSDDVQFVKDHLIDCRKYDIVEQCADMPVHISLAAMAECKHFIIGNTSFGWWAQYLSDYKDKIVVAPSKWYGIDVPCDIYQDNWHVIEV